MRAASHFILILIAILFGVFALAMTEAQAGPARCNWLPMANIIAGLQTKYGELAVGLGMLDGGTGIVTVFAAPSGSFTLVLTDTEHRGCILLLGTGWQTHVPKPGDPA